MRTVAGLYVHYIKSCRATPLEEAAIGARGIEHDREWMIVRKKDGSFVTQREKPALARIVPILTPDGLQLSSRGRPSVEVARDRWSHGKPREVTVWKETCAAIDQGFEVSDWLSELLADEVSLVRMSDSHVRASRRVAHGEDVSVGFADGFPFLLTSKESLADLNGHLSASNDQVPMSRFRPNIVVEGCDGAWEEDAWNQFRIGSVRFHGAKPCVRCVIITTDQYTGERPNKREPIGTLSKIHSDGKAVLFGMNLNHTGTGTIRVGDEIQDIQFGPRPGV